MGIEDPDVDRLEQLLATAPDDGDDFDLDECPMDADPLDVADQHRAVPLDDESES